MAPFIFRERIWVPKKRETGDFQEKDQNILGPKDQPVNRISYDFFHLHEKCHVTFFKFIFMVNMLKNNFLKQLKIVFIAPFFCFFLPISGCFYIFFNW